MDTLKPLTAKRGRLKASLTRIIKFVEPLQADSTEIEELKIRRTHLQTLWNDFEKVQSEIEEIQDDVDFQTEQEQCRAEFESQYFRIYGCIESLIENNARSNNGAKNVSLEFSTNHVNSNVSHSVRLPQIDLPKFAGDYLQWPHFFDTFNNLIHEDSNLSKIQKFHYLKSVLVGKAAAIVQSLEMSESNYDLAWSLLEQRFNNKRAIVYSHVNAVFQIKKTESESSKSLRDLYDLSKRHIQSLSALGLSCQEQLDAILINLLTGKLDPETLKKWEVSLPTFELPSFSSFDKFLLETCNALEAIEAKNPNRGRSSLQSSEGYKSRSGPNKPFKNCFLAQDSRKCPVCKDGHPLFRCQKFIELSSHDKWKEVKKHNLCINCFSSKHFLKQCTSSTCRVCKEKHNTLLHRISEGESSVRETSPRAENQAQSQGIPFSCNSRSNSRDSPVSLHNHYSDGKSQVLLSTAVINVDDINGTPCSARVVLDSGSQLNFITRDLAQKLRLPKLRTNASISGLHDTSTRVMYSVRARISSRLTPFEKTLNFHILPSITGNYLPAQNIDTANWNIPPFIKFNLADPDFHTSSRVDALIGGGLFYELIGAEQFQLDSYNSSLPLFRNSPFGWIAAGDIASAHTGTSDSASCLFVARGVFNSSESDDIQSFRTHKDNSVQYTPEQQLCENNFVATYKRSENGRFIVNLPLKDDPLVLGDSLKEAVSRFRSLERRFDRQPHMKREYVDFIRDFVELGHMEKISTNEIDTQCRYYLPHHPVFKKDSSTTRTRVVFDASSCSSSGYSLNDILMVGPTIQEDLFSILLRFRFHRYVATADVAKMYRQVLVDPKHVDLQRIVWRESPDEELSHFRLLTVVYGTSAAPYLATRCLEQLARENAQVWPRASEVISRDFYVDDLMTGADTVEELNQIYDQVSSILLSGGFSLRKWSSNSFEFLSSISTASQDSHYIVHIEEDESLKLLGLIWKPSRDSFQFHFKDVKAFPITKRSILSDLCRVFDPLGFLTPVLIRGKIFVQQLWQLNLNWDDVLPHEFQEKWVKFKADLALLDEFVVPRFVKATSANTFELHGFCDASQSAYGACIYVRSCDEEGLISVRLLCSKSRVASLGSVTLPRLELCGAVLLAQLMSKVSLSLMVKMEDCHFWTDSTIVLSWIAGSPSQWKTYVANRVSQIQELSNINQWEHVSTDCNPADIVSRGISAKNLVASQLWLSGPIWLSLNKTAWPTSRQITTSEEMPERKKVKFVLLASEESEGSVLLSRYSTWNKLIRVTALVFRFIGRLRRRLESRRTQSQVDELDRAKIYWCKVAQASEFSREIKNLQDQEPLHRRSKLLSLAPYLDDSSLIRVGGRLENSKLTTSQRHPILLPPNHPVTRLIFKHYHTVSLHSGPQTLLTIVRQQYWPLNGRNIARRTVHQCQCCFKYSTKPYSPIMGQLPQHRVVPSRPFASSGVDFCGPVYLRTKVRSKIRSKAYIAIFVCFATRAVHIELVSELTTAAFLAALRRFLARRGICSHMYSDNGTNFVGAARELRKFLMNSNTAESVQRYAAEKGITWHFNPPGSPHFGGLWEAAVKSTKYHMKRVVGNMALTYEEMVTVLTQIEAVLNSRPLCPLSCDPNDPEALTPAHFLIGSSLLLPAEPDVSQKPANRLKRWQLLQSIFQQFWRRWSKEYLGHLQQLAKWRSRQRPLQPGTLVLLKEDNLAPFQWRMGRVENVHPGSDGVVRVATIRFQTGALLKRAVTKLCPLLSEDEGDNKQTDKLKPLGFQGGENVGY